MTRKQNVIITACLLACVGSGMTDIKVTKIGDTVVDTHALTIKGGFGQAVNGCSFQQDAIVTHGQHQYVGYYDSSRYVCIARRKLPSGKWEIVRLTDYHFKSNDSHNTISIGICPSNGTIHLAFDHHGHPLHYRVSRKGAATKPEAAKWDAALFSPVTSELEKGKPIRLTYPRFWRDQEGTWHHNELPGVAGTRAKIFLDKDDNACAVYSDSWSRGLFALKGGLCVMAATPESKWQDWRVIHVEEGPFVNEMLGDPYRWKTDGILSIMVQGSPEKPHAATPLRILDFTLERQ